VLQSAPAIDHQYGSHPPASTPSVPAPPTPVLPAGWLALWDPLGQKWGYLEVSNSKVIWTVPTAASIGSDDGTRGLSAVPSGHGSVAGYGALGGALGGAAGYGAASHGTPSGYGDASHGAPGYGGAPGYDAHGSGYGGHGDLNHDGNAARGYGGHDQDPYGGHGVGGFEEPGKVKKDDGKKNMLVGAAGGLAVGAIGGAVIASALGELFLRLPELRHIC
jgi:hypothetical protein